MGLKLLGGGVGAGANYMFQPSGQTDLVDVGLAGATGFLTTGSGFLASGAVNVGGSLLGSGIKRENPNPGIASATVGTVAGFAVGKAIEVPLGKVINSQRFLSPDWVDVGYGISRWNAPSPVPGMVSGVGSSLAQEPVGNDVKDRMQGPEK